MDGHTMPRPIYEEGDVSISEMEAAFGDKRFNMAAILGAAVEKPMVSAGLLYGSFFLISTGLVGVAVALADAGTSNGLSGPVGVCLGIAAVGLLLTGRQILRPFKLMLSTTEGETTAYASFDPSKLEAMRRALDHALSHRA